jgi:hypothetical protein
MVKKKEEQEGGEEGGAVGATESLRLLSVLSAGLCLGRLRSWDFAGRIACSLVQR